MFSETMASGQAAFLAEGQVDAGGVDQGQSFTSLLTEDGEAGPAVGDDDFDELICYGEVENA